MVRVGIDDQPHWRAEALTTGHDVPAVAREVPVIELADQNQGRHRDGGVLLALAKRVVGDGGAELPVEQPFNAIEADGGKSRVGALRVSDDGDAFGIDKRLAGEIEQRAIGIHHQVDRGADTGASVLEAARAKAVDREQGIAQRVVARAVCLLDLERQAPAAGWHQHHRRERAVARRQIQLTGDL